MEDTSKGKKLIMILAIVAIVFVVGIGAIAALTFSVLSSTGEGTVVAKAFVQTAADGDYAALYESAHEDLKTTTTVAGLEQFVEGNLVLANAESVTFNKRKIENDLHIFSGTVTATDGEQSVITVHLLPDADGELHVVFLSLLEEDVPVFDDDSSSSDDEDFFNNDLSDF